jgi:hypothetical protein
MIPFTKLQYGKEYYIKTYDTEIQFKFVFDEYQTSYNDELERDVNMIFRRGINRYVFYEDDYYYDPEQIKRNAQIARNQMEERSMNMVLKKLVNEEFKWS